VVAFRTSVGDFDIDNYMAQSDFKGLMWIAWFLTMFLGNIIFMNFIIAVVNESYENCMMRMEAQSYRVKAHMIAQREAIMSPEETSNDSLFPRYLVIRRPAH
jgi:hypothetical protein